MSTDDGKRLMQLHDAMQDRIRELEDALRDLVQANERWNAAVQNHARYVLAKGIAR